MTLDACVSRTELNNESLSGSVDKVTHLNISFRLHCNTCFRTHISTGYQGLLSREIISLDVILTFHVCFFLFLVSWGGVRLSPLGTSATILPIVPAPDDRWILSRVRVSVTNNNGFWIGWLDLLTPFVIITLIYSWLWQLTTNGCLRLAPFRTGLQVSSLLRDWLGSDLRVGHFSASVVHWWTLHSWTMNSLTNAEWLNSRELNWISICNFEANRI
jgi:hypothetical protein